jgi:uncharacterized protein YegL
MSLNIDDIKNSFVNAAKDGDIDGGASQIMINALDDTNLIGCGGEDIDDIETDDVTVVSVILDASISMTPHQNVVRECYDRLIVSLRDSKQSGSILVSARTFATRQDVLYGFKKVDSVQEIEDKYSTTGNSTALYNTLVEAMTSIRAYVKELNDNGIRTKCIVVVFSDGEDNDSKYGSDTVKALAEDFIRSEMFYLVYVGYKQDADSNLEAIAKKVGFPNSITTNATESEIRKTMDLVSKSIVRTSQTQIGPANSFFN